MKRTLKIFVSVAFVATWFIPLTSSQAVEEPAPSPAITNLPRAQFPEQLKGLTPAERDAKLKEFREKFNADNPQRKLMEKRREELKNLSPEQREAKMREWRQQQLGTNSPAMRLPTPEEREARRKIFRARLEQQLQQLREQKTNGTITPEGLKRLERMEEVAKRFAQATNAPAQSKGTLPIGSSPKPAETAPVKK